MLYVYSQKRTKGDIFCGKKEKSHGTFSINILVVLCICVDMGSHDIIIVHPTTHSYKKKKERERGDSFLGLCQVTIKIN